MEKEMTNAMHRERARDALKGKWFTMILITVSALLLQQLIGSIVTALTGVQSGSMGETFLLFVLNNIIYFVFTYGLYYASLKVIRGRGIKVEMIFTLFEGEYYLPMLFLNLLDYVCQTIVKYILLVPVAFIFGYSIYRAVTTDPLAVTNYETLVFSDVLSLVVLLALFILLLLFSLFVGGFFQLAFWTKLDQPQLSVLAAVKHAVNMMSGHYKQYITLVLSFAAWYIIGFFALGIGILWAIVYNSVTFASFYDAISQNQEKDMIL